MVKPTGNPLDLLFVSEQPLWPLDQGFKVHGSQMLRALRARGLQVASAAIAPWPERDDVPADLLELAVDWPQPDDEQARDFDAAMGGVCGCGRRRLIRHLIDRPQRLAGVLALVDRFRPAAVIGLGLHSPIMLRAVRRARGVRSVWYGADELVYFHLSCLRREPARRMPDRLRQMAMHALLENLFVRGLDGAIGVSPTDVRLLRWLAGARRAVLIRNGVDLDRFGPAPPTVRPARPDSLVFWGRLDFEPNVDAVCWFADRIWPLLRHRRPGATFRIVGPHATAPVRALGRRAGIELAGRVPDVREAAWGAAATILPMRCGGGIKNKLLEAAALARPIVASPRATQGLAFGPDGPPLLVARTPESWVSAVRRIWSEPPLAARLGTRARTWAERHHDWATAARTLADWVR